MTLLNYSQVSELLGVNLNTLYSMKCRGQIPCVQLSGRLIRFDSTEIDAWVASHRVPVGNRTPAAVADESILNVE
jgi:excisionase family DNA binding protein